MNDIFLQYKQNIDILNTNEEKLYKPKCKFLSNIDISKYYYLKINDKYLTVLDTNNNMFLIATNNIDNACLFKFNSDGNIIELKLLKCLKTNGNYIILTDQLNDVNNKIILEECKYSPIQTIQNIQTEETEEIKKEYENFKSLRKEIKNKLENINYCSNPVYKTIVLIILVGILIYFIWIVTRKKYIDDINVKDLVSTPFTKNI